MNKIFAALLLAPAVAFAQEGTAKVGDAADQAATDQPENSTLPSGNIGGNTSTSNKNQDSSGQGQSSQGAGVGVGTTSGGAGGTGSGR